VIVTQDITARRRAEQELKDSEERFRSLFEQATEGILLTDEGGIVLAVNQAMENICGVPRSRWWAGQPSISSGS